MYCWHDMSECSIWFFYQSVFCFSMNREVTKNHNSHCLKTSYSDNPVFLAFESKSIYFATAPDWRGIAEWYKVLTVFVLVIIDFQTIAFWTAEVQFPSKAHSFHCGQFSLIRLLNPNCPITDKNYYLHSSIIYFDRFYSKNFWWGTSRTANPLPYSCDMRQLSKSESEFGISLVDKSIYFITYWY